jgi:hypothetical protein
MIMSCQTLTHLPTARLGQVPAAPAQLGQVPMPQLAVGQVSHPSHWDHSLLPLGQLPPAPVQLPVLVLVPALGQVPMG